MVITRWSENQFMTFADDEKDPKRSSVLSVTSITLVEIGILPNAAILLLLSRVLFLVVTMAYYYHLGRKPKKI